MGSLFKSIARNGDVARIGPTQYPDARSADRVRHDRDMSAGSRIRTGEPLREEILSLSPLTRLGNSGLKPTKPPNDNKTIESSRQRGDLSSRPAYVYCVLRLRNAATPHLGQDRITGEDAVANQLLSEKLRLRMITGSCTERER